MALFIALVMALLLSLFAAAAVQDLSLVMHTNRHRYQQLLAHQAAETTLVAARLALSSQTHFQPGLLQTNAGFVLKHLAVTPVTASDIRLSAEAQQAITRSPALADQLVAGIFQVTAKGQVGAAQVCLVLLYRQAFFRAGQPAGRPVLVNIHKLTND